MQVRRGVRARHRQRPLPAIAAAPIEELAGAAEGGPAAAVEYVVNALYLCVVCQARARYAALTWSSKHFCGKQRGM